MKELIGIKFIHNFNKKIQFREVIPHPEKV